MKRTSPQLVSKRVGTLLLNFVLVYSLSLTVVLACSGPGTDVLIEQNRSLVRVYAIVMGVLVFASVVLFFLRRRKGLWVVLVSLLLLVVHPAWFYRGGGGDCGMSFADGAKFWGVIVAIGTAYQLRCWLIERGK